ncbi:hypothetical protein MRX96_001534 [Rhipicephalus microplus]
MPVVYAAPCDVVQMAVADDGSWPKALPLEGYNAAIDAAIAGGDKIQISDVAVFTYLLCSVKNPRKVLKEVKRVLVKGGSVVFLEHVGFPNGTWQRLLQSAVTPLSRITCCNCHLNRDSVKEIENAGFSKVTAHYIDAEMNVLLRRPAYGMAVL